MSGIKGVQKKKQTSGTHALLHPRKNVWKGLFLGRVAEVLFCFELDNFCLKSVLKAFKLIHNAFKNFFTIFFQTKIF